MMKRTMQITACVMAASLLASCATAVMRTDLSGSKTKGMYPATRADVTGTYRYLGNELDPFGGRRGARPSHHPNAIEKVLWVVFAAVDLPISLITDTVCLPWDFVGKTKVKEVSRKAPEGN